MSGTTATLALITNVDGDNARAIITTDESANMTAIDALFHATTGHNHTGTGTKGTLIPAAALAPEAWGTFTVFLSQNGVVASSSAAARYKKYGRLAVVYFRLVASGAGGASQPIVVGVDLPGPITPISYSLVTGTFRYLDSGTTMYTGVCSNEGGAIHFYRDNTPGQLGVAAPTLANGDVLEGTLIYETAS